MRDVVIPYEDFTVRPNYPYSNLSSRDEHLFEPASIITQLFNPAGPGPVCVIRNPKMTWMDANRPEYLVSDFGPIGLFNLFR
ncbi:hypothetical protein COOONC_05617 [Cooperia oncophora]